MINLIAKLAEIDPKWRENIASDPLDAAVELGLIEPEDLDAEMQELEFND